MPLAVSWWIFALVAASTAPVWVRALAEYWQREARLRTQRLLESAPPPQDGLTYGTVHKRRSSRVELERGSK